MNDRDYKCVEWMWNEIVKRYHSFPIPILPDWEREIRELREKGLSYKLIHDIFIDRLPIIDDTFHPRQIEEPIPEEKYERQIPPPEYYEILQENGFNIKNYKI